ncbi:GNAT family N-acetyltransferase [uncultured Cyclobacterium sp.]|uniref:GNAT family N-acetyltransferase n=1 Tax=uncultured Cyclobacterium sp. TaxID=453820 RepID=UPI0030EF1862|tara:strand:- start:76456 stop:76737 length:282 start_codon:yes stop_codon:yes gene_type:complete
MNQAIKHIPEQNRFELELEGGLSAFILYKRNKDHLDLIHSEVPKPQRGQGIGRTLVFKTLEQIEKEGLTATALCPYIKAVVLSSEKWKNIINH